MFTGLIEAMGTLTAWRPQGGGARMVIRGAWPQGEAARLSIGDSVAVNGACLTVVEVVPDQPALQLGFDLSHETLALTGFADLQPGDPVNLERALRLGDRLGGHLVTGHVDGLGCLVQKIDRGDAWDLLYAVPPNLAPEIVHKGSLAIDGVSLTVNGTPPGHATVTIIPHTATHTQLLWGREGKRVHLETDLLAKHVRRLLQCASTAGPSDGVTLQLLGRAGFLGDRDA